MTTPWRCPICGNTFTSIMELSYSGISHTPWCRGRASVGLADQYDAVAVARGPGLEVRGVRHHPPHDPVDMKPSQL